jgi:hypothetical protein
VDDGRGAGGGEHAGHAGAGDEGAAVHVSLLGVMGRGDSSRNFSAAGDGLSPFGKARRAPHSRQTQFFFFDFRRTASAMLFAFFSSNAL